MTLFTQEWYDEILKWDPKEWGNTEKLMVPAEHMWTPDVALGNRPAKLHFCSFVKCSMFEKENHLSDVTVLSFQVAWKRIIVTESNFLLLFSDSADWLFSAEQQTYMLVALWYNGRAQWSSGGVYKVFCNMDNTYFPFDTHICFFKFETWRNTGYLFCTCRRYLYNGQQKHWIYLEMNITEWSAWHFQILK